MVQREKEEWKMRLMVALGGHTNMSRDCYLSGEYLTNVIWPIIESLIATAEANKCYDAETANLARKAFAYRGLDYGR